MLKHHHCQTTPRPAPTQPPSTHTDTPHTHATHSLELSSLSDNSTSARDCLGTELVMCATDELCHVIRQHLSQHQLIAAEVTSTCSARRMLPVVPGTSTLPVTGRPTAGCVLASSAVLRCQSARPADSRPVSMKCFPLKQHSNDLY